MIILDSHQKRFFKINIIFLIVSILSGIIGGYFVAFITYQSDIKEYQKNIDGLMLEISTQRSLILELEADINNTKSLLSGFKTQISYYQSQILILIQKLGYGDISTERARELIKNNPTLVILDVRTYEEYTNRHIEGAINIPIYELKQRLPELNNSVEILVYCGSGLRSSQAVKMLIDNGFIKVYNMIDGFNTW